MFSNFNNRQKILVFMTPLWVIVMIVIFPVLTYHYGNLRGFLAALFVYWFVLCLGFGTALTGPGNLLKNYRNPFKAAPGSKLNLAMAVFPVIMVFFATFIANTDDYNARIYLFAAIFAVVNGSLEELFWRGTFLQNFPDNWRFATLFPWLLFILWHVALALCYDVEYEGGAVSLISGAAFLGLIWTFITWRSRSIFLSSLSHIAVNFFAFSGLIYTNYFAG